MVDDAKGGETMDVEVEAERWKEIAFVSPEECRISEHITLKLEGGTTNLYIDGKLVNYCKRLVINTTLDGLPVEPDEKWDSVDDMARGHGTIYKGAGYEREVQDCKIDPQTEFDAHCSAIHAWYALDYNSRAIHSNLAFPLLKALVDAGDVVAKTVFLNEIVDRIETGSPSTIQVLVETQMFDYVPRERWNYLVAPLLERTREGLGWNAAVYYLLLHDYFRGYAPDELAPVQRVYGPVVVHGKEIFVENGGLDLHHLGIEDLEEVQGLRGMLIEGIDLSENGITALPPWLFDNDRLVTLKLRENSLEQIPASLEKCIALKELDLRENALTSIPGCLAGLPALESLDLSMCRIAEVTEVVTRIPRLKCLYLEGNPFPALPDFIARCTGLEELTLWSSHFSEIPPVIGQLRSLKMLEMRLIKVIPDWLFSMPSLRRVLLSVGSITTIPASIKQASSLVELDLGDNKIAAIPVELAACTNLIYLRLNDNPIQELPDWIGKLVRLRKLDMSRTRIEDLPDSVARLVSLDELSLVNCMFEHVPRVLYPVLEHCKVSFAGNPFTDTSILDEVPPFPFPRNVVACIKPHIAAVRRSIRNTMHSSVVFAACTLVGIAFMVEGYLATAFWMCCVAQIWLVGAIVAYMLPLFFTLTVPGKPDLVAYMASRHVFRVKEVRAWALLAIASAVTSIPYLLSSSPAWAVFVGTAATSAIILATRRRLVNPWPGSLSPGLAAARIVSGDWSDVEKYARLLMEHGVGDWRCGGALFTTCLAIIDTLGLPSAKYLAPYINDADAELSRILVSYLVSRRATRWHLKGTSFTNGLDQEERAQVLAIAGIAACRRGAYKTAVPLFIAATCISNNEEYWIELGNCFARQSNDAMAMRAYRYAMTCIENSVWIRQIEEDLHNHDRPQR